jgi:hypothetical protein
MVIMLKNMEIFLKDEHGTWKYSLKSNVEILLKEQHGNIA